MDFNEICNHWLLEGLEESSKGYAKEKATPLKCFGRGIARPPLSSIKFPESVLEELFPKGAVFDHMATTSTHHILDIGVHESDEEDEISPENDFQANIPFKNHTPIMTLSDDEIFFSGSEEEDEIPSKNNISKNKIENNLDYEALHKDSNFADENDNTGGDTSIPQRTGDEDDNTDADNSIPQSNISNSQNICSDDIGNGELPSQDENNRYKIDTETLNSAEENALYIAHSESLSSSNRTEVGQMANNIYNDTEIKTCVHDNSECEKKYNRVKCDLTVSRECNVKEPSNDNGSSCSEGSFCSSERLFSDHSGSSESMDKPLSGCIPIDSISPHETKSEYSKHCNDTFHEDYFEGDPKDPVRNRKWIVTGNPNAPFCQQSSNNNGFWGFSSEKEFPDLVPKKDCSVRPKIKTDHSTKPILNIKSIANSLFASNVKHTILQNSDEDIDLSTSKMQNSFEGNCIVIENIPQQVDREELKSLLQGFGEVQKLLLKSTGNKIIAKVRIDGDVDWIIECLDGYHAFGASSEALVCRKLS